MKTRRVYKPRLVGGKVMMPADLTVGIHDNAFVGVYLQRRFFEFTDPLRAQL
jgi:hypothetical protein